MAGKKTEPTLADIFNEVQRVNKRVDAIEATAGKPVGKKDEKKKVLKKAPEDYMKSGITFRIDNPQKVYLASTGSTIMEGTAIASDGTTIDFIKMVIKPMK